jgi:hypothetical protein
MSSSFRNTVSAISAIPAALLSLSVFVPGVWAQVNWTARVESVLFPGEPGSWDSAFVGAGDLLKNETEQRFYFYFTGSNSFTQGYGVQGGGATSSDLIHWEKFASNPCLPGGDAGAWDEEVCGFTVVLREGDGPEPYKMWYHGARRPWTDNPTEIGFATSADGIHWNKYQGNPILTALPGTWENISLGWPNVIYDANLSLYRMWYNGLDWNDCNSGLTGYAESTDGIHWERCRSNPVFGPDAYLGNVGKANVLLDEATGLLEMFYDSSCGGLDYATSLDGKTWCSYPGNPLQIVSEFDSIRAGPVLWEDGRYRMLYRRGAALNDGYATSPWTLPRASFTAMPRGGFESLTIDVDTSPTATPGPPVSRYEWDFGDGSAALSTRHPTASHTYTAAGHYAIRLTVTDEEEKQGCVARGVDVEAPPPSPGPFLRGDCNGDGSVSGVVTDAIFMLNFNFLGGPAPGCVAACDADADGAFSGSVTDAIYVLNFNFLGGPAPPAPFPGCDLSHHESDAALGCANPLDSCL